MAGLRIKGFLDAAKIAARGAAQSHAAYSQGSTGATPEEGNNLSTEVEGAITNGPSPIRQSLNNLYGKNKKTGILGVNFSLASMLKQSQITTGTGTLFQLAGAVIDWVIGKGIMLALDFHKQFVALRMKLWDWIGGLADWGNMLFKIADFLTHGLVNAIYAAIKAAWAFIRSQIPVWLGGTAGTRAPEVSPVHGVGSVTTPLTTTTNQVPQPGSVGSSAPVYIPGPESMGVFYGGKLLEETESAASASNTSAEISLIQQKLDAAIAARVAAGMNNVVEGLWGMDYKNRSGGNSPLHNGSL